MPMVNYKGGLGEFTYDDTQFQLVDCDDGERLVYVGRETDGSKIAVPKGLTDASEMFSGTNLVSAPRLPEGVTKADFTYSNCDAMVNPGTLPEGLKSAQYCYFGCLELPVTPDFPSTLEDMTGMFDNCPKLREVRRLPPALQEGSFCFANCPELVDAMELPDGVKRIDGMFLNCGQFEGIFKIPDSVLSAEDCLTGCENCSIIPDVPDGVVVSLMIDRMPDHSGLDMQMAQPQAEIVTPKQEITRDGSELGAELSGIEAPGMPGPEPGMDI